MVFGLTYAAVFWANATSLPLFARYFAGDVFNFGYMYSLFGYDVYFGELLLTILAIALACFVCAKSKRGIAHTLGVLTCIFVACITTCFVAGMLKLDLGSSAFNPQFVPDKAAFSQILRIACISPWAFIGFESISHSTEEFAFNRKKSFSILTAAIVTVTLLYVFVTLSEPAAGASKRANASLVQSETSPTPTR